MLSLVCQVWLTAIADNVFEKHGSPDLVVLLALSDFLALLFFQLDFEFGCFGVLLGVDGFGDASPEGERLVGKLLVLWG